MSRRYISRETRRPSDVKQFIDRANPNTPRTDMELDRIGELPNGDIWAGWKMLVAFARKLEVELATLKEKP